MEDGFWADTVLLDATPCEGLSKCRVHLAISVEWHSQIFRLPTIPIGPSFSGWRQMRARKIPSRFLLILHKRLKMMMPPYGPQARSACSPNISMRFVVHSTTSSRVTIIDTWQANLLLDFVWEVHLLQCQALQRFQFYLKFQSPWLTWCHHKCLPSNNSARMHRGNGSKLACL